MAENAADLSASIENMTMYPRMDTSTFMAPPSYYQEIASLDTDIRQPAPSTVAAPTMGAPMMAAPMMGVPMMGVPMMAASMMTAPVIPSAPTRSIENIGNIVKLNVGGVLYQTTKSTLKNFDGLLNVMIEDPETPIEDDDAIFIDRSAIHFDKILNYLRDGHVALPDCMEKLQEIKKEAKYYLLDGLADNCEMKIAKINAKKEPFAEEVKVLNSHGELLQVITDPQKPVLIIYYHVGTLGRLLRPRGFAIKSFLDKYQHKMNIYFSSYTIHNQASSINPTDWCWSFHYRTAYSFGLPTTEKLAKGGVVNVEPFQSQLEKAIRVFVKENSIQF